MMLVVKLKFCFWSFSIPPKKPLFNMSTAGSPMPGTMFLVDRALQLLEAFMESRDLAKNFGSHMLGCVSQFVHG